MPYRISCDILIPMKTNPFYFGKEVSGDYFYDRAEAAKDLSRCITGGINVVVYAPRRYGKTSLVKRVAAQIASDAGMRVVYVDLMKMDSVEQFCSVYVKALMPHAGMVEKAISKFRNLFKSLRPSISIDPNGNVDFSIDLNGKAISAPAVEDVLNLPNRLATEETPLLVIFDEFQEIARLSDVLPMEGIFRSVIQAHENVRYVFLGSKTHLMKRMFTDHARPFYKSATLLHLDKPPVAESMSYVIGRMKAYGVAVAPELAADIVARADSLPYYVQALSFHVFETTAARNARKVSSEDVEVGTDALLAANRDLYEAYGSTLPQTQRKLLTALAGEPTGRFTEDYRRRHALGVSSTVNTALARLMEAGFVEQVDGRYEIGDPFFKRYLVSP